MVAIWANTMEEVIYYKRFADPAGNRLSGDHAYTLHFPKDQLPEQYATYFWWSSVPISRRHCRRHEMLASERPGREGCSAAYLGARAGHHFSAGCHLNTLPVRLAT